MAYETRDQKIEKMHKAKMGRYDARDVGQGVGASVNKAVDLVIAMLSHDQSLILDDAAIARKIQEWTDRIYAISLAKKNSELFPSTDEIKSAVPEEPEGFDIPILQDNEDQ